MNSAFSRHQHFNRKFEEFNNLQDRLKEEKISADEGWKTYEPGRVTVKEFNLFSLGKGAIATWTAPVGYNQYLKTGNFKGCRPIIPAGARINTKAFETINFVMV